MLVLLCIENIPLWKTLHSNIPLKKLMLKFTLHCRNFTQYLRIKFDPGVGVMVSLVVSSTTQETLVLGLDLCHHHHHHFSRTSIAEHTGLAKDIQSKWSCFASTDTATLQVSVRGLHLRTFLLQRQLVLPRLLPLQLADPLGYVDDFSQQIFSLVKA